jgi:hypothetical protein
MDQGRLGLGLETAYRREGPLYIKADVSCRTKQLEGREDRSPGGGGNHNERALFTQQGIGFTYGSLVYYHHLLE